MIWTILGISVAVVGVFCVSVAELLVGRPLFEDHRGYIAIAFGVCGAVAWFTGRYLARNREAAQAEESAKLFVIFDLRYWGPMLVVLGVITLFIHTIGRKEKMIVEAHPAPPSKKVEPEPVPEPEPPKVQAPVVFPSLHVQGIILRGENSVVILNGHSYGVGDYVNDVVVKEITRDGVTLEKSGELRLLPFGEMARATPFTTAGR